MRSDPKVKWISIEKELTNRLIGTLPYLKTETQKQYLQTICIGSTIKNCKQMCIAEGEYTPQRNGT